MKRFSFFLVLVFFTLMFISCSTDDEDVECYVADDCPAGFGCDPDTLLCYELSNNNNDLDHNNTVPDTSEPDEAVTDLDNNLPDMDEDKLETPVCGDGNIDNNEECDDGNNTSGDGCSAECKKEETPDEVTIPDETVDEDINITPDETVDTDTLQPDNNEFPDENITDADSTNLPDEDTNQTDTEINDADAISTCAESTLNCGLNAHCDDTGGTPTCVCDSGYQDADGNGNCNPTCATSGINCNEPYGGTCFINSNGYAQCQCKTGYTSSYCNVCDYDYVRGDFPCEDQCFEDTCWNATDSMCGWLSCSYFDCQDSFISGASCN